MTGANGSRAWRSTISLTALGRVLDPVSAFRASAE